MIFEIPVSLNVAVIDQNKQAAKRLEENCKHASLLPTSNIKIFPKL